MELSQSHAELLGRREQIVEQLATQGLSKAIENAYRNAVQQIDKELDSLRESAMGELQEVAIQINQIIDAKQIIAGLVDTEELDSERHVLEEGLEANEPLFSVLGVTNASPDSSRPALGPKQTGDKTELAGVKAQDRVDSPEVQLSPTKVHVQIQADGVRFGKSQSRHAPLSEVAHPTNAYVRAKLIVAASEMEGEFSRAELWAAAFGEDAELDEAAYNGFKLWSSTYFTYNNAPIIEHNGMTGRGSKFFIPEKFNLIVDVVDMPDYQPDSGLEAQEKPQTTEILEDQSAEANEYGIERDVVPEPIKDMVPNRFEMMCLIKLARNGDEARNNEIENLVCKIGKEIGLEGQTLRNAFEKHQEHALQLVMPKLRKFHENLYSDEVHSDALDKALEFLFDSNDERLVVASLVSAQKTMPNIHRVIRSAVGRNVTMFTPSRSGPLVRKRTRPELGEGDQTAVQVFESVIAQLTHEGEPEQPDEQREVEVEQQPSADPIEPSDSSVPEESPQPTPTKATPNKPSKKSKEQQIADKAVAFVNDNLLEVIETLRDLGAVKHEELTINSLGNIFGSRLSSAIKNASENNIISRGSKTHALSLSDITSLVVHDKMGANDYNLRSNRKLVAAIKDEVMTRIKAD